MGRIRVKTAKQDFTETSLPENRRQSFSFLMKTRYRTLIVVGFWLAVFSIPLLATIATKNIVLNQLYENYEKELAVLADEASKSALLSSYKSQYRGNVNVFNLIIAACLGVSSLGFAGSARVIRQLIWLEPVFFREDFVKGIKDNWKNYLFVFLVAGILHILNQNILDIDSLPSMIRVLPTALALTILFPVGLFILSETIVYGEKLFVLIRAGFTFYIKSFLWTLLFSLMLLVPAAIGYLPNYLNSYVSIFVLIFLFLIFVFLLPILMMAWEEHSFRYFDMMINEKQYPEIYKKGLFCKK